MKIRKGFVSNSSATAFILDIRNEHVKRAVDHSSVVEASGTGRSTAMAVGKEAVEYAEAWIASAGRWYEEGRGLGPWILKWAEELGHENIVFAIESDEDNGLDFHASAFSVAERDYH